MEYLFQLRWLLLGGTFLMLTTPGPRNVIIMWGKLDRGERIQRARKNSKYGKYKYAFFFSFLFFFCWKIDTKAMYFL